MSTRQATQVKSTRQSRGAAPLLTLENLHRHFGDTVILQGVNLTIQTGEAVAIVGPSGSGKSTLLHVAGLLDSPDEGRVVLQGQDVGKLRDDTRASLRNQSCGFVYQFHHLLREFTAVENVVLPSMIEGKRAEVPRATALLQAVGLGHRLHHLPGQLSGGEQQRVAIARALMNRPALLLADEPTGNLDPHTAQEVTELLFRLIAQEGMAALIVTHNPALAARCHRQFTMHEGVLQAFQAPQPVGKKPPVKPRKS
jgi:lipoprotein-releasing system ATP-binding protein